VIVIRARTSRFEPSATHTSNSDKKDKKLWDLLLVAVNKTDEDELRAKDKPSQMLYPIEMGIRASMPEIELVQRSPALEFVRRIRRGEIAEIEEHGLFLH
jgi:hypothetical protein